MNELRADSPALGLAGALQGPPRQGWPLNRWLILIALVFAAHVGLLFMLGARKQVVPRTTAEIAKLKLANGSDELLALNDPTLFALPRPGDFVTAIWSQAPVVKPPTFRWTEPPRWLRLSPSSLLTVFNRFAETNRVAVFALQLRPPIRLSAPSQFVASALPQASTMRIEGDLRQRRLVTRMDLTNWPYADVIAPSKVRVLVDQAGIVISAVLLPSNNSLEALSHYDAADQRALELARTARFAPAPHLTIGEMIFTWHTVPPSATNSSAALP